MLLDSHLILQHSVDQVFCFNSQLHQSLIYHHMLLLVLLYELLDIKVHLM